MIHIRGSTEWVRRGLITLRRQTDTVKRMDCWLLELSMYYSRTAVGHRQRNPQKAELQIRGGLCVLSCSVLDSQSVSICTDGDIHRRLVLSCFPPTDAASCRKLQPGATQQPQGRPSVSRWTSPRPLFPPLFSVCFVFLRMSLERSYTATAPGGPEGTGCLPGCPRLYPGGRGRGGGDDKAQEGGPANEVGTNHGVLLL